MSDIQKLLSKIQQELKAPKGQYNAFSKYNYRSCEDILSAVKPLLGGATVTLSDEMIEVGGRVYVKATATLSLDEEKVSVTAFARESDQRKGMNSDQLTGATSSYARKYAMNGMFAIDDTKDSDTTDHRQQPAKPTNQPRYSWSEAEVIAWFALDQDAKNAKWDSLNPALQSVINARVNNGN